MLCLVENMTSKVNVIFNLLLATIIWNFTGRNISINEETKLYIDYPTDFLLNFTEITSKYGYISEEHKVITEDGYVLTTFRIVKGENCGGNVRRPPVIMMHGLLQSSDAWLDAGPQAGLAYLLSDACYDLWVGNQRGNYYARQHERLNPDSDAEFWDFSVDEIGLYDIPATIDYVLKHSDAPKVNYIGYSQGTCTFFIMCSERPGYCDKVNLMVGLSPATRHRYTKSVLYRFISELMMYLDIQLRTFGNLEILAKKTIAQEFLALACLRETMSKATCTPAEVLIDSNHPGSISNQTLRAMFSHFPAGTSLKNIARYGQSMRSNKFQKFDYGEDNLNRYGVKYPPVYNLSAVTVPFVTLYGKNDYLVDPRDLFWTIKQLPTLIEAIAVADPLWNHFDTMYSQFSKQMIFPKVHEYLQKYSMA